MKWLGFERISLDVIEVVSWNFSAKTARNSEKLQV